MSVSWRMARVAVRCGTGGGGCWWADAINRDVMNAVFASIKLLHIILYRIYSCDKPN